MRATLPPLSASSAPARTIAPRNYGSHGINRTLGTSRTNGKGIKPKSKSGSGHHVHLPRISMDSSPPLVSFRHSRIKPSTLTEAETGGVPGVTPCATDRQSADVIGVKLSPQSHHTRRNEQSPDMERNSKGTSPGRRRHSPKERLNDTQSSRQTTLQTPASATGLSNPNKPEIPTLQNTTGQTTKNLILEPTPQRTTKVKARFAVLPDEVEGIESPKKNHNSVHQKTTGEATVTSTATPTVENLEHSQLSAINTNCFSSSVSRYQNVSVDSKDLTMSEYTSIFINNNGFEGEKLSVVKSDTFLGEKRSVRFSVSNEIIEYEPGVSLSDDKQSKLDNTANYEIIGE